MSTERDIHKLYLSNFLTGLVFWYGIEQLFMLSIGLGTIGIGINIAFLAAFSLVFDIPSGMIADRWSRKYLLVVSAVALAIASVFYGSATSLATFLVGTVFYGIYMVTVNGTYQAITYDTLHELGKEKLYSKISGRAYGLFLVGAGVGNIASGFIASHWSYRVTFFVTVISCLLNIIVMLSLHEPRYHKDENKIKFLFQVGSATKRIVTQRLLAVLVSMAVMLTVISVFFLDMGQVYMSSYISGVEAIGILWAVYAFALALGSFIAHYFYRHVWVAVVLASLPVVGMMIFDHPWAISLIFVQAVGANILLNQIETRVQEHTPSSVRATILSVISAFGRFVAIPVSIYLGWLIEHAGIRVGLWVPTVAAAAIIVLSMAITRSLYMKNTAHNTPL
ncbi:MAG: MFS transporter [Candidatus Saccharimonadales bacterium]